MTLPALALFYGGLVQAKNILSVLVQCFAVACLASVLWFACGYSLAFSGTGDWIGDWRAALPAAGSRGRGASGHRHSRKRLCDVPDDLRDHHPGADHRRLCRAHQFAAVLLISGLWLLLVYVAGGALGLGRRLAGPARA